MSRDSFEEQWLADLPSEWVQHRADFLCQSYRVTVDPERFGDDLVAHYSIPQVQETGGPAIETASDIASLKLLIKEPTLLVSKLNPRKSTICIAIPDPSYPTLASSEFVALSSDKFDQKYAYYLWSSEKVRDRLSALTQSATRSHQRVNPADITKIIWKWPSLDTQQRIARFLDEKTARIDMLIEKKQALLNRLAEKRQALITRAVTKGLNPDVPMKPSGVDWLGDIPSHWDLLPLRRVTRKVTTGRTPPSALADYFTDGDVNWFTPGDFGDGMELCDSERKIASTAIDDGVVSLYPSGTVFLVAIGATLGKVAIAKEPGSANQQVNAMIMEGRNSPQFLAYFIEGFRNEVRVTSNGNTLAILNQDGTKSLMVLKPPVEEQEAISAFLIGQDQQDLIVIGEVERSCQLLVEYRAALVSVAVTGQLPELNE
ncbi:restriction endonuclease subunit S [Xanthomonas euvesicatoria]|uniref:restriction endonuclease subunit S n=1 Tax=Xanthomonas euvesicatoria TaxID=456327 RepID=UPI001C462C2F|nr:restriction endonuclease subunit S [Xanthomonas euvesicatoria]MBV6806830.1 restriction endonuclease subunit S [Xanthomonas campestris pv. convolvuli]